MGPYLGTPNTEKDSENGEVSAVRWGATSMQGWRKSQEDAHICATDLPDGVHVFGVFDGHGGKEVSIWVKEVFVKELNSANLKNTGLRITKQLSKQFSEKWTP